MNRAFFYIFISLVGRGVVGRQDGVDKSTRKRTFSFGPVITGRSMRVAQNRVSDETTTNLYASRPGTAVTRRPISWKPRE